MDEYCPVSGNDNESSPSKKKVVRAQRITSLEGYMARNLHA